MGGFFLQVNMFYIGIVYDLAFSFKNGRTENEHNVVYLPVPTNMLVTISREVYTQTQEHPLIFNFSLGTHSCGSAPPLLNVREFEPTLALQSY